MSNRVLYFFQLCTSDTNRDIMARDCLTCIPLLNGFKLKNTRGSDDHHKGSVASPVCSTLELD